METNQIETSLYFIYCQSWVISALILILPDIVDKIWPNLLFNLFETSQIWNLLWLGYM